MTQSLLCQKNQQKRAIHTAAALSLYSLRDVKALGTKAATPQNEYLPTASRRKAECGRWQIRNFALKIAHDTL